jgi:hypothetical protein
MITRDRHRQVDTDKNETGRKEDTLFYDGKCILQCLHFDLYAQKGFITHLH